VLRHRILLNFHAESDRLRQGRHFEAPARLERRARENKMLQRFLDPATLNSISGLDLIAKRWFDGFVAGLHRSPDFGFSQEFAEYRAYAQGDDLRHVDWNVFARTGRCYLNATAARPTRDCWCCSIRRLPWAMDPTRQQARLRALSGRLALLPGQCAARRGRLIVFDEDVTNYVAPSTRQGQLFRLLHAIEQAHTGTRTDFTKPFVALPEFPAPPRHGGGDLGLLRRSGRHRQNG